MREILIELLKLHGIADFDGHLCQCSCGLWVDNMQTHQIDLILNRMKSDADL